MKKNAPYFGQPSILVDLAMLGFLGGAFGCFYDMFWLIAYLCGC